MKKLLIVLVLLTSTILFADAGKGKGKGKSHAVGVKVFNVNHNTVKVSKEYPATVKAQKSVNIIARVSGNLEKRYFTEGSFVKKGQNLYKIEQRTYQANIDSAIGTLNQAKALLVRATSDWERYEKLFENKSISAYDKDQYFYSYENAKANVQNAKAAVTNAKIQHEYTMIKAPMDGIVSTTMLNEGNFVDENTVLTTITKVDPVYAEFSLPQADIAKYLSHLKSKDVKFSLNCKNSCVENGVLNYVSPTIDSSSDTLLLRAEFDNKNGEVIVGQFTNITIENIAIPNVITIPEEAIMQNGTHSVVYVVDENSTAKIQPVQLAGSSSNGSVSIKSSLKVNAKIIISNIAKVRPNAKVKIIEGK